MQIALNHGKDTRALRKRSSDIPEDRGRVGYAGPPRQKETTIKPNEFLKHLNHLDFCLKPSDEAFHHPFHFSLAARSSIRVRGEASEAHRRQKDKERTNARRQEPTGPQAHPGGRADTLGAPDTEATADGRRRPRVADIPAFAFQSVAKDSAQVFPAQ